MKDALGVSADASLGPEGLSVAHQLAPLGPISLASLRMALAEDVRGVFKGELGVVLGELKRLRKEISTLSQQIDHLQGTQVKESKAALARFTRMDLDFQDLKLELMKPGWFIGWVTGWLKRLWAGLSRKR